MNRETINVGEFDTIDDLEVGLNECGFIIADYKQRQSDKRGATDITVTFKRLSDNKFFGITASVYPNNYYEFWTSDLIEVFPKQITTTIYE